MKSRLLLFISSAALALLALSTVAMTGLKLQVHQEHQPSPNLVQVVREATQPYKNLEVAEAAGYGLFLGCVSGPQEGAMGIHYPNGSLIGDGALDPAQPEILVYEVANGRYSLVAVEYIVLVDDWNANHSSPPVLMGQVFNYNSSPNRYGMPAFYELHVWAWKTNPNGVFADWNPLVTCEEYR